MKVLGLISSPEDPASRVRVMQYKEPLSRNGVSLHPKYYTPMRDANPPGFSRGLKKITGISEWRISNLFKSAGRVPLLFEQSEYDLIWQNRLLLPFHSYFERKLKKPLVFDFDDAIWLREGERQVVQAISRAVMVFAGNPWLADYASKHNKNVRIVPSVVDTGRLFPLKDSREQFVLGWIGSPSNFKYLELIRPSLLEFLSSQKDSSFELVSSEKPPHFVFDDKKIVFRKWSAEKENELINRFSVGLMPLAETDWEKGKCGYKLLQYLACGKPVIASPVGVNKVILEESKTGLAATSPGEWLRAFRELKNDPVLNAGKGREWVIKKYSLDSYAPVVADYFKTILSG